jgi:heme-degrading monooxygenase HmoA
VIARVWHGITDLEKADDYLQFVRARAIPEYKQVTGNRGAFVLRRIAGDVAHFLTLSFWESMSSIEGFAGSDISLAKYYPEDSDFLLEFEPTVSHYELYDTEG